MILRAVVRPETVTTYHPQTGRVLFDAGSGEIEGMIYLWNAQPGSHTNENFRILIVSCSEAAEQKLDYYPGSAEKRGWPGISELPEDTRILVELRNYLKMGFPNQSVVRGEACPEVSKGIEP